MPAKKTASKRTPAKKRATTKKTARKRTAKKTPNKKRHTTRNKVLSIVFWPYFLARSLTSGWSPFLRWLAVSCVTMACFGLLCLALLVTFYTIRAQSYDMSKVTEMPARSIVYASDGETEIGTVHGDNRLILKLDQISPYFIKSLIAREDARFYEHGAIDLRGVVRAAGRFVTRGKREGASTISMQLADNSFNYKGKTIDGKLLEMALAVRIENAFSKEEILEHYMNRIFWGHTIRGIESASRTYFEKPAHELNLSESALLAGIIRGPNTFSPFRNLDKAIEQRDVTLNRMVHYKFITKAEAEAAKAQKVHIRPHGRRIKHDSYAMDAIRADLTRILEQHNIDMGGLHIRTTIDPALQKAAEQSVEKRLKAIEKRSGYPHQTRTQYLRTPKSKRKAPQYMQGAVVCIDNKSGAIRAIVGGRNADESKYNRALTAKRQIGSLFKPFVYLTAFEKGMHAGAWVRDTRIRPGEITGANRSWSPANSDGTYKNIMTVSEALAKSRNTPSVRIGDYAGIDKVIETARRVGFHQKIPTTPATFLGAFEATPQQVAQAYSVFPNGGTIHRPYIIAEITDIDGNVVYPGSGVISYQATKKGSAWSVSNTLQKVTDTGTARSLRSRHKFEAPCAGKTGTTDNYRDAWFAGYTSSLTCAVWVGMDNNKRTINRGYGSTLALPIWADIMKAADQRKYPTFSLAPKFPFERHRICRYTSQRATKGCEARKSAYTASIPVDQIPQLSCDQHPVRAVIVKPEKRNKPPRALIVR